MYNKVFLIGHLARNPELRYTPSGIPVTTFAIAVNRIQKKGSNERDVDFINIVAWRRLAEVCNEYLKKGKLIAIEGRLQIRQYKDKSGRERNFTEVVAEDMRMLGKKSDEQVVKEKIEDDIPF
ncbi:single-stranded DNA-binding protein [Candidatus Margulisiibacteriota bacterium]